jgi:hypothetical protein
MDELEATFEQMGLGNNYDLVLYVRTLAIPDDVKTQLIYLIENDSYSSYMDIYNICLENDIELPPI